MRFWKALIIAFTIILAGMVVAATSHDATASSGCSISVSGTTATVVCAGVSVGTVKLPVVQVTQTIPGAEVTKFIKQPGPTIVSPGPTMFVAGPTQTVTVTAGSKPVPINPQPTFLPSTPRQTHPNHAMIDPAIPMNHPHYKSFDLGDGHTTVTEATLSLLATMVLIGMFLCTWYIGYTLGFREADSKNANFIQDVLDESATRR